MLTASQGHENTAYTADENVLCTARLEESALAQAGITILVGHAGVGKTNLALNLALAQAALGRAVTLTDLDLVNPYFRSSDYPEILASAGVRMVAPVFAHTGLDTPSMGGELPGAIERAGKTRGEERLIIDVGGDDIGATALGRYAAQLVNFGACMYYVVNAYRNLTATPEEAAGVLRDIEGNAHVQACGIVNCSNLAAETTWEHVAHGRAFARELAQITGLPLACTVVPEFLLGEGNAPGGALESAEEPLIAVQRIVRPPWE